MASSKLPIVLGVVIQLLSLGLSIAICVITAQELWYSWSGYITAYPWWDPQGITYDVDANLCLLSPLKSTNICAYSWSAGAIGILFAIIILFTQFGHHSRKVVMCEALVVIMSWIWWLGMAITTTVYGTDANETYTTITGRTLAWPQKDYRVSIYAMGWSQFGLYCVQFLLTLMALSGAKGAKEAAQEDNLPYGANAEGTTGTDPVKGSPESVPMPPQTMV